MEEEDAILGLGPASLPVQPQAEVEMTLPAMNDAGAEGGEVGWSFEKALRASSNNVNAVRHDSSDHSDEEQSDNENDDDDESDAVDDAHSNIHTANNNHTNEEVVFRDGDGVSGVAAGGGAAASGHAGDDGSRGGEVDDDALLRISDKKEAKRLGKKLYKRWKKLIKKTKKHKGSKSKKEKKSSSKKKSGSGSKGKGKGKRKSRAADVDDVDVDDLLISMGNEEDDNEIGLVPAAELSDAAADIEARLHKAALRESKMRADKASKKAAQQKSTSAEVVNIAKELVAAMAKARRMDDDIVSGRNTQPGVFPLHRVALKDLVQARCRQAFMVGPLVEAGIMQELSYWLYDVDRAEPAPYELRTTALDILMTFPLEGSIAMTDDLTQFMGVSREHLIKTDIGRALNALRKFNDETVENRGKCVQLLASFSRVISGTAEKDQNDENKSKAVWKCQRDPTVASPFEVLETCSEALQKSFMKPNPRDPTSYNGLLPWRPPAATITNVSGTLNNYIEKAVPNRR
ncbi:hypothetical protein ABB37_00045 [Leptomonas pyrrhocoris]|uniref:TFIIS N-terminal domain-containing protein n=1 Tax=Leptomonas pyrrhocoris TaxID=157538 RepID=A0A0M9G9P8_LEPPY|nr:hypothetical protein ABB37_00045 [Leptomonas pyrrhocoris]KPA85647.1 hypothetical protein ABB37_00045 [Leptomonas pyrrhocoris]|eukprot:XP_015664086.1 hypothetical protein ABB37_00045 [Leptomonas pyrrhocoris]